MERISTETSGACFLISRVACSPVSFGIFTSRIARSGRSRTARSRASAPSGAPPAAPAPPPRPRARRPPPPRPPPAAPAAAGCRSGRSRGRRRSGPSWGRFSRDREANGGAMVGTRLDRELGTDQQGALAHAADPEAALGLVESEAAAVVGGLEEDAGTGAPKPHLDAAGTAVAGGVGERLLGDAVDDQLGVVAEVGEVALDLEVRVDLAAEAVDLAFDRRDQAE